MGSRTQTKAGSSRKQRALAKGRNQGGQTGYSLGREILATTLGIIGVIFGLIIIAGSIGFWYGSQYLLKTLNEIGHHNFSGQEERIQVYEDFFNALRDHDYEVIREEPKIDTKPDSSSKYYLWRVQTKGAEDFRIYRWQYDLRTDEVTPETNAALILDIARGFVAEVAAQDYGFYDAGDDLAWAIASNDFTNVYADDLGGSWQDEVPGESPVSSPRISPSEAEGRESEFMHTITGKEDGDGIPDEPSPDPEPGESVTVE